MFGRSDPELACPVTPQERSWIEGRIAWLAEEFGWDRMRRARVVLPSPEFFPDPFDRSEESARLMLDRICGYMGVAPQKVEMEVYEEARPPYVERYQTTAGMYEAQPHGGHRVWVEASILTDPLALAATLAHELGHVLLLGEGRISADHEDHEPLTDLLTVFLGLGVVRSNATVRESNWRAGEYSGWSMSKNGYLTMPQYGYVLALFAQVRGEDAPSWMNELRPDVRAAFKQAARYLEERGDVDWKPLQSTANTANMEEPHVDVPPDLTPRCTYCGVEIDPRMIMEELEPQTRSRLGVCADCGASMEENAQDRAVEQQEVERQSRVWRGIYQCGCLIVAVFMIAVIILSIFKVI